MSGYASMSGLGGYNAYDPTAGLPINDSTKKYVIAAVVVLILCCCCSSSMGIYMSTSTEKK